MPLQQLASQPTIVRTCLQLALSLLVLYDPDPMRTVPSFPDGVEVENLFQAIPQLRAYMQSGSPIERFYAFRATHRRPLETFEHKIPKLQAGKLLVRKVAAIHYAISKELRRGGRIATVIWCDADVGFTHAPDALFFAFASRVDVAYVPFKGAGSSARRGFSTGFDGAWYVESGLMAFAVNQRSLAFVASALELYEGGMLRLLELYCSETSDSSESTCPKWMNNNLYFNDIYIWSMVAHLAGIGVRVPKAVCCLDYDVTQGWLPFHTSTLQPSEHPLAANFSFTYYAFHRIASASGSWTARLSGALGRSSSSPTSATPPSSKKAWPPGIDDQLAWSNVWSIAWNRYAWNTTEVGIPLEPRLARCGCTTLH